MTTIADLETPCVLIDLDRVERNLQRWQTYCDEHGLKSRPHIKTHKLPEFALRQIELGAIGIACQKLGEAEVMADAGIDDILIPYNIIGASKLERAVALAHRINLTLSCDSLAVAEPIAAAFHRAGMVAKLVIECETGGQRCGVLTPAAAVDLAKAIEAMPGATFAGLMTYPPAGAYETVNHFIDEAHAGLRAAGIAPGIVSNGGTPDMWRAHLVPKATEHRVGTYIYNDLMQVAAGAATLDDCALKVMATVVSRPEPGRGAIDAGSKALTSDLGGLEGHGLITEYPKARIAKLSEEHGHLELGDCDEGPEVGERVTIIHNHACPVSNLVDVVYGVRGDVVEKVFKVAARGKIT